MSLVVRAAGPEDATTVAECLRAAFAPYEGAYTAGAFADTVPSVDAVRDRIASTMVFVAIDDGVVAGTVSGEAHGSDGHLRGLAVSPSAQGRRVASRLLAHVERALADRGCTRVTLDTTEPLARAAAFYMGHGYARTGRVADFFGMPLFEYAKDLTARD